MGDLTKGCMSAGGHFNPANAPHGGPLDDAFTRHAGDLGNIEADAEGVAEFEMVDAMLSLQPASEMSIIGRSVIVHADEDDLGRGSFPDSKTTGHAGARLACGVIGLAEAQ
jgi:Cu-Zn family superoxide dismutase